MVKNMKNNIKDFKMTSRPTSKTLVRAMDKWHFCSLNWKRHMLIERWKQNCR